MNLWAKRIQVCNAQLSREPWSKSSNRDDYKDREPKFSRPPGQIFVGDGLNPSLALPNCVNVPGTDLNLITYLFPENGVFHRAVFEDEWCAFQQEHLCKELMVIEVLIDEIVEVLRKRNLIAN